MIARTHRNTKQKFDRYANPSPAELPNLWAELSAMANMAPEGERGGIHRLRSRLLAGVPNWCIPTVLDELTAQEAAI